MGGSVSKSHSDDSQMIPKELIKVVLNNKFAELRTSLSNIEVPLRQYDTTQYLLTIVQLDSAQKTIMDIDFTGDISLVDKSTIKNIILILQQHISFISCYKFLSTNFKESRNICVQLLTQISNELTRFI